MRIVPTMLVQRRPAPFVEVSDEALSLVACTFCGVEAGIQCARKRGPARGSPYPWRESHYARFVRASRRKR